ncbi:MAG: DUF1573 domain-containing protein [Bacteroidales bacterium]|nr:DUF1573 domain-containing protein [Bacteroidales bacterium]
MKKFFCLVVMTLFAASFSLQAQEENTTPAPTGNEPEITFEKLEHDYGNILKGDNGTCQFRFTNTGKSDLVLTNVRSSCGCTVPSWPKESIAPGQSSVITVKYNTQRIGIISKTITVESNAINNRIVLRIKGNVADIPQEVAPENPATPMSAPQNH